MTRHLLSEDYASDKLPRREGLNSVMYKAVTRRRATKDAQVPLPRPLVLFSQHIISFCLP
ncbi:hypothetical protein J6590_018091 [Homalodisca vitripennis]|nr:hypothetical protein J6590_018091 [Homalodisca vitripennis]